MRITAVRPNKRIAALAAASLLWAGQLAPLDSAGFANMLEAQHGKVVLIDFWATWCDPCREELPKLVALSKKLKGEPFQFVTVSADEPEQESVAAAFLERERVPQPRYIKRTDDDQAFIDSVDKKWSGALPALFLYDRSGVRIASFIGESEIGDVEAAVRKALNGGR